MCPPHAGLISMHALCSACAARSASQLAPHATGSSPQSEMSTSLEGVPPPEPTFSSFFTTS